MHDSPSSEEIAKYAGKWVGQVGDQIVVSADTPQEVVRDLRNCGLKGSVWRVPASEFEAKSVIVQP